jgi:integrase
MGVRDRTTADPAARSQTWLGTLALQAGIHPKVVMERLGHANIAITLDTYSHVTAGLHEDAAEQVAALFQTPVSNPLAEGQ